MVSVSSLFIYCIRKSRKQSYVGKKKLMYDEYFIKDKIMNHMELIHHILVFDKEKFNTKLYLQN